MTLRESAERLTQYAGDGQSDHNARIRNARIREVAQAYLSEHPLDDEEKVDEAWLRSVGFHSVCGVQWFLNGLNGHLSAIIPRDPASLKLSWQHNGEWLCGGIKTRRQVRALLSALQIQTKGE